MIGNMLMAGLFQSHRDLFMKFGAQTYTATSGLVKESPLVTLQAHTGGTRSRG